MALPTGTGVDMARLARRVVSAGVLRWRVFSHRGDTVQCPVCGHGFDRFADDPGNRPEALCWRCGSHERHRAQWLLLQSRPQLLNGAGSVLHFAPEWSLRRRLNAIAGLRYVTADLAQRDVDLHLDVTALDLPDDAFGGVICSHVLEHVDEDGTAMRELCRVTAPGGWCLVMVPIDSQRSATYEDPSITDPAARTAAFWQHDHVRLYAPDIAARLERAGFVVERVDPEAEFGAERCRRHGIPATEMMWLCRARGAGSGEAG